MKHNYIYILSKIIFINLIFNKWQVNEVSINVYFITPVVRFIKTEFIFRFC